MNTMLTTVAASDVSLLSVAEATKRIVRLTVATAEDAAGDRLPLNICLALDKSASMSGPKLETLKQAAISLLDRLHERDMISVLAFDGKCDLVAPTTTLFAVQKRDLAERIAAIRLGQGTALLEAYLRSAGLVADHLLKQGVNEVILVTDGRANKPAHPDPEQLREHAGKLNKLGVQTSVYGIGEDIKPYYLVPLAIYGGGTYSYLPHVDAAMFQGRESHLFNIVARATTVQITTPIGVSLRLLGDIPHRVRGGNLTLFVGNLSRGQRAVFHVEMVTPTNALGLTVPFTARTTYVDNAGGGHTAETVCLFRYAEHAFAKSAQRDMAVRRGASLVRMGYAIHKALFLSDAGREREAISALREAIARIKYLAPGQIQELNALAAKIEAHSLGKAEYQSYYYQAYQHQEPRR